MNITFMIGNGFDVNLGLKTKFTDFYDTYFKSELDRDVPDSVKNFIQLVLNDKEKFGNLDKWSDFEKAFAENIEGSVEDVRDCIEDFTIQFAKYLTDEDEKCDYSDESFLKKFEDFLFQSCEYLENLDKQKIDDYYHRNAIYDLQGNTIINNLFFVNFNYTSTLYILTNKIKEKLGNDVFDVKNERKKRTYKYRLKNIIHIHGNLKSNIIIGIDSTKQFCHQIIGAKKELEGFIVKKAINYNSGNQERDKSFDSLIKGTDIIYMYGLSLGETDKSRWDIIKDWIKESVKHKLIYFAYRIDLKMLNRIYAPRVIYEIKKIKEDVLCKLGFATNELEKYYNQIFIIDSSDVLNFKLVDENKEPEANMN